MRKIEPELITGMGYIGDNPGVLYRMGGAGEQTVVTGNPALLEGVKGSRFTALAIYGKSTQGSTTGAQLCDFRNINTSGSGDIIITFNKDGIGIVKGTPVNEAYAFTILGKPVDLSLLEIGETYTSNESIRYTKKDNPGKYFYSRSIMFTEDIARIDVYVQRSIQNYKNGEILSPMLNKGNTVLAFEPYTGGAPSPSPSYSQEIESAGQSGEIGVTVTGTNLLPFEVGQKGDGFEAFADGVQVDVGRNVDIYAVGVNDSLIESGYSEFPLLAPGKYYIYSDIQGVNLYVVVWRKGANVTLGYSSGGVAKEIEVMAGDKFRIFLRTAAAFKGKVKAMITRIPVDATSYEPYKPAQTLIIPTPGGLPGIPVSSGGNYTDKDGQQWVADEIDLAKGERVQWIEEYRFTGAEEWLSWGVNSGKEGITGFYWYFKKVITIGQKKVLNTHAAFNVNVWGGNEEGTLANISSVGGDYLIWSVRNEYLEDVSSKDGAVKSFKKLLGEINAKMLYCLATPIRTPLPPETIAAYKALHTYSPTTTVINDAGAGMIVGYKRK